MLDSSTALLLLILLGVMILVILSVTFLIKIGSINRDVESKLAKVEKSICKLESKINTSKYVDTVVQRIETSIRGAENDSSGVSEGLKSEGLKQDVPRRDDESETKVIQSPSNEIETFVTGGNSFPLDTGAAPVSQENNFFGAKEIHSNQSDIPRKESITSLDGAEDFWKNLERKVPGEKQALLNPEVAGGRDRFGRSQKNDTVSVDIAGINEEPAHSLDSVIAGFGQNAGKSFYRASEAEAPNQTAQNQAFRNQEVHNRTAQSQAARNQTVQNHAVRNRENKPVEEFRKPEVAVDLRKEPWNYGGDLSFAEKLKQGAQKFKEFEKEDIKRESLKKESVRQADLIQPVAQEKVIKSVDSARNSYGNKAAPHFVDRASGIDRRGRVYSVEQLKEQIK